MESSDTISASSCLANSNPIAVLPLAVGPERYQQSANGVGETIQNSGLTSPGRREVMEKDELNSRTCRRPIAPNRRWTYISGFLRSCLGAIVCREKPTIY